MSDSTARLDRWKQSLLDLDERLLDLGDEGIPIATDPVRLAFSLAAGSSYGFDAGSEPSFDSGRLRIALPADELAQRLAKLRRAARAAAVDGDHVLWVGLGLLTWSDEEGVSRVAPLVLWPVELSSGNGAGEPVRLVASADKRPRLNDMLLEGLRREHDLTLATGDDFDLGELLDTVAQHAFMRDGWHFDRVARLATFSFVRFDLWRDLEARDALASAPVAWLAGETAAPQLVDASASDVLAPLDADATQLAAIAAAGSGASFVLQGAPGTGKTQTIANVMVHCATQGKTVLVVSDRASALDVIHQRLSSIGLGELALPLHAGHDSRANVLGNLARVLDRSVRLAASTTAGDARLAELRGALDGYVTALHKIGAFGMSVHEVLGRLVELRTAPCAALAERDAPSLDRTAYDRRKRAIDALAEAALPVEPVALHPWRMSTLETWPVDGTERATRALNEVRSAVELLVSSLADIAKLVPGLVARTPEQLRAIGALAELAAASPRPGAELLTNMRGTRNDEIAERIALIRARGGGKLEVPRDPATFLAIATRHRALALEVDDKLTDAIENLDAGELWAQLKRWTSSMAAFRYVALRSARAEVRGAAQPGQLETDEAMIDALEAVIAERACRAALVGAADSARRWFGDLGGDALSLDLGRIEDAVVWGGELRRAFDQLTIAGGEAGRQAAWRALVAQVAASPAIDAERPGVELAPFARLAAAVTRWSPAVVELATVTGIAPTLLGAGPDHLVALREQAEMLFHAVGSLVEWTKFHLARKAAIVAGVGPAIAAIERGDLVAGELAAAWQRATLLAWVELELAETPELARFHGPAHHVHVASFADLDRGSLALMRARAVARVAERVPRRNAGDPEVAVLRGELAGTTGRSLRAVLAELPTLLPRVAPCVLATPHAIAQHLDPSLPMFDVVVFDEASRLPIAHALGALSRARAAIIVGDSRQPLPADGEGLVEVAREALAELSLGTHYRSRHEDLFAFANSRYYADRIEVLPAPCSTPDLGISWRRIDGAPDAAGANRAEAEAIAADVRARLADPSRCTRSIAIVTLSRAQHELLEELLDAELAMTGEGERLLIGTPDRLQGEERDVVLVSIGDSADALGALAHPGGERWLDVAITRARDQLVLFSSFAPEDIAGDVAPCARDLSELLAFARAGGGAGKPPEDVDPASPITAAIARALTDRGWIVRHRVGCGAFKIDLAVVDPNDTDRYVLAIEHDGSAYASSTAARSRDRLRAQLLTQLGWRLHRVWALDWWTDAEREIQRAHGAIVAAIAASRQRRVTPAPRQLRARASVPPKLANGSAPVVHIPPRPAKPAHIDDTIPAQLASTPPAIAEGSGPAIQALAGDEGSAPLRLARGAIAIGPYTAAAVPAGRRAPDDMFAPRYLVELGKCVEQVLAAEAPIHVDLLARRVAAYFGIGRVTQRVSEQVQSALLGRGKWGTEKGVVWRLDQDPTTIPAVRVAGTTGTSKRDIAEIPLCELAAAARIVVERVNGVATNDLVRDCARLLGFARMTDKVAERVSLGIRLAAVRELIAIDAGKAHLLLA